MSRQRIAGCCERDVVQTRIAWLTHDEQYVDTLIEWNMHGEQIHSFRSVVVTCNRSPSDHYLERLHATIKKQSACSRPHWSIVCAWRALLAPNLWIAHTQIKRNKIQIENVWMNCFRWCVLLGFGYRSLSFFTHFHSHIFYLYFLIATSSTLRRRTVWEYFFTPCTPDKFI